MQSRPVRGARLVSALLAVLSCAVAACVGDGSSKPEASPATFELTLDRALLWEIAAPEEQESRLYLLGSVHMLDVPLSLGPGLARTFRSADVLVLEIDLRNVTPEEAAEVLVRYGALAWGEELSDLVSADTLQRVETYCFKRGFSQEAMDQLYLMRPWAIAMMLESLQYETVGLDPSNGVDMHFLGLAGSDLPIVGLETLDEQMYALSSHSDRAQEEMLLRTIEPPPEGSGASPMELVEAWKSGDADALAKIVLPPETGEEAGEFDEFYETVFFARNARMADSLAELLEEGEPGRVYFAVVGAAHLVGQNSIPELLRDAGFTVSRARD